MPRFSDYIHAGDSEFLKAKDIDGRKIDCEISEVFEHVFEADPEHGRTYDEKKLCLRFKDKEKCLVLNKVNGEALMAEYGDDTDSCVGAKVRLSTKDYGGQWGKGIVMTVFPRTVEDGGDDVPF